MQVDHSILACLQILDSHDSAFPTDQYDMNARVKDCELKHCMWLKECEIKLRCMGRVYEITEVSNQYVSKDLIISIL